MELYVDKSLKDLKAEAKSRKLRYGGQKDVVISNLREADWKAWRDKNQTFNRFPQFPLEIQRLIWQHSLPKPRVLPITWVMSATGRVTTSFPKKDRTPNPVVLMVCRTSRDVALKKYRPVFGQKYMYADLAGGDMLYFGLWYRPQTPGFPQMLPPQGDGTDSVTRPKVAADLDFVTAIILHYDLVRKFHNYATHRCLTNCLRVRLLARFKNLEKVSLVCGGTDRSRCHDGQGQIVIEDDVNKFTRDVKASEDSQRRIVESVAASFYLPFDTTLRPYIQDWLPTLPKLAYQGQSEDLFPEVNLVQVNRIFDEAQRKLIASTRQARRLALAKSNYCAMRDPLHPLNQ